MTQKKSKPSATTKKASTTKKSSPVKVSTAKKKAVKKPLSVKAPTKPAPAQFVKSTDLVDAVLKREEQIGKQIGDSVNSLIRLNDVGSKTLRGRMLAWFKKPR